MTTVVKTLSTGPLFTLTTLEGNSYRGIVEGDKVRFAKAHDGHIFIVEGDGPAATVRKETPDQARDEWRSLKNAGYTRMKDETGTIKRCGYLNVLCT